MGEAASTCWESVIPSGGVVTPNPDPDPDPDPDPPAPAPSMSPLVWFLDLKGNGKEIKLQGRRQKWVEL